MTASGVFRRQDRVFHPWKNGGGETAEILAWPAGAGFDGFDWRISTAVVAASGPFSVFPGVDRVLTVIDGGAMRLSIGEQAHRLDSGSAPFAFPGDVPVTAELEREPLLDFNVMVRRPFRAEVVRGPLTIAPPAMSGRRLRARAALLLDDRAGLSRLDLVDLSAAGPELVASLAGAPALDVRITG